MGIKAGSGRGSADVGGSKPEVPGGVGSSRKRGRNQMPPPPPKKPLKPVESPLPQKPEFRLGQYRVLEERDDYLICTGFDPNAKNPLSEVTPSAFRSGHFLKIAKPWELQRTLWDGQTVEIGGVEYTYEYSDSEKGVRTATDEDGNEEEQRIDSPYLLEGYETFITAAEIRKSAAVDGMDNVTDDDGTRLRWMDLNVAGRHWKSASDGSIDVTGEITGPFTIVEYDATSGEIVSTFYRKYRRTSTQQTTFGDYVLLHSSDGFLYAAGDTISNHDTGTIWKWNKNTGELIWASNRNGLTAAPVAVPSGQLPTNQNAPNLVEADDGAIWVMDGSNVARHDPDTGEQTHAYSASNPRESLIPTGIGGGVLIFGDNTDTNIRSLTNTAASAATLAMDSIGTRGLYPSVVNGQLLVWIGTVTDIIGIYNASTLASVTTLATSSNDPTGMASDGTTAFMARTDYEGRDVTNLSTLLWTGDPVPSTVGFHMFYRNGALYHFMGTATRVLRIDPSNGTIMWNITSGAMPLVSARAADAGTDFVVYGSSSVGSGTNIHCLNASDGSTRWTDFWGTIYSIIVTDDDRIFACGLRREP